MYEVIVPAVFADLLDGLTASAVFLVHIFLCHSWEYIIFAQFRENPVVGDEGVEPPILPRQGSVFPFDQSPLGSSGVEPEPFVL